MTIEAWLEEAHRQAERRELPELKPLFDALAQAIGTLRAADWNEDASGHPPQTQTPLDVH